MEKKRIFELVAGILILILAIITIYFSVISLTSLKFSFVDDYFYNYFFMTILAIISSMFIFFGKYWAKITGLVVFTRYLFVEIYPATKVGLLAFLNIESLICILGIISIILCIKEK